MEVRKDRGAEESDARRIGRNMSLRRTGMIFMIPRDQITMRNTGSARRRFGKSGSGRTGSMRIGRPEELAVIWTVMKRTGVSPLKSMLYGVC
jgi:hypothetical protein